MPSSSPILYDPNCVFCKVARSEVAAHVIARDDLSMVFLDRSPVFLGHCLVIPISHYETLGDVPDKLIAPIFLQVKNVSSAVQKAMKADGAFVGMNNKISQSVAHAHVHVVPRKAKDGLKGFFWPRQKYSSEEQALEIQEAIRRELASLNTP